MVLKEAKAKLRALQPIAAKMNEVSDTIRDEIKEIEEDLAKLNIGLPVTLPTSFVVGEQREESDGEKHEIVTYDYRLGYQRHESQWRLVVKKYRCVRGARLGPDPYDGYDWDDIELQGFTKPLLEAPRRLRVEAAAQIPQLLDLLKRKAEEGIKSVENVTAAR